MILQILKRIKDTIARKLLRGQIQLQGIGLAATINNARALAGQIDRIADFIRSGFAIQLVIARPDQDIVRIPAIKRIRALTAIKGVMTAAAKDGVVTRTTINGVA